MTRKSEKRDWDDEFHKKHGRYPDSFERIKHQHDVGVEEEPEEY